VFIIFNNF